MSTPFYRKARGHLTRRCPVMKRIIATVGPCTLVPDTGDPFTQLVRAVIAQQISTLAARSIFKKLATRVNGPPVPMAALANLSDDALQECGLSGAKRRTLRAIVDHVNANPELLTDFANHDDDAIRKNLTQIKGIGPWTADMFLIFSLGRPDVLPVGDYGLKAAVRAAFERDEMPGAQELQAIAKPWQPYRSIATWYLWRTIDPPVQSQ